MKPAKLMPLAPEVAACSSAPAKEDSLKVFLATNTAMASAQTHAVTASRGAALLPGSLTVAYTGACLGGGSVAVNGDYEGKLAPDDKAAFDLTMQFTNCKDELGTLDGSLQLDRRLPPDSSFNAAMTGAISYRDISEHRRVRAYYTSHLSVLDSLRSSSYSRLDVWVRRPDPSSRSVAERPVSFCARGAFGQACSELPWSSVSFS